MTYAWDVGCVNPFLVARFMVFYVAIIAVLNLGLGYAVALYMERSRRLAVSAGDDAFDTDDV